MKSQQNSRIALVTGSGRGIGRATALALAEQGQDVIVLDLVAEAADETARLITKNGGRARAHAGDVSDLDVLRNVVTQTERDLGTINVLVNNAGVGSDRCAIEDVTPEMFERSMRVHVRGTLFATQAVVPGMKLQKFGRIINISSIQGLVGWSEGATYNAAKGAVLAMAKGWAKEFAPWGITVNAVAPGHTETDMTVKNDPEEVRRAKAATIPLKRYAQPEEMAYAIAFLASDRAGFITGQALSPNGGVTIT